MIFLLSASGMSSSNELSLVLLKVSNFLLITSCGVQTGGHLL